MKNNYIVNLLGKNKKVLEPGIGTGNLALELAKYCNVTGIDKSSDMIMEAKKKNQKIKLYIKDASRFNLSKKFDAIICYGGPVIFFFEDNKIRGISMIPSKNKIKDMFKSSKRHMKKNGFLFVHNQTEDNFKYPRKVGKYLHNAYNIHKNGKFVARVHEIILKGKVLMRDRLNIQVLEEEELEKIIIKSGFRKFKNTEFFRVYKTI